MGALTIRALLLWGLYWGPLVFGKLPNQLFPSLVSLIYLETPMQSFVGSILYSLIRAQVVAKKELHGSLQVVWILGIPFVQL